LLATNNKFKSKIELNWFFNSGDQMLRTYTKYRFADNSNIK